MTRPTKTTSTTITEISTTSIITVTLATAGRAGLPPAEVLLALDAGDVEAYQRWQQEQRT